MAVVSVVEVVAVVSVVDVVSVVEVVAVVDVVDVPSVQLRELDLLVKTEPSTSLAKTARMPPFVVVNGVVMFSEKLIVPESPAMLTLTSLFSVWAALASDPLFGVR